MDIVMVFAGCVVKEQTVLRDGRSFLFLRFLSSYIYTYKDHSLRLVVRRPYSGLTVSLIFSYPLLTFTSVDGLVATAEHCLISLGLGLDLCTATSIFSYYTASSIFSTLWTDPLHAMRRGSSTCSTLAVLRLCGYL